MMKYRMMLGLLVAVLGAEAQVSNEAPTAVSTNQLSQGEEGEPDGSTETDKKKGSRRDRVNQRRIQLMERELDRIGITDAEKTQIKELQKLYRERMNSSSQKIEQARQQLTDLMDASAPMEALEQAIQAVADAQAEQLRILVNNRLEMEQILGKERHALFMKKARTQYQKHGRRSPPPIPPRASLPPIPGANKTPPPPPTPQEALPVPQS